MPGLCAGHPRLAFLDASKTWMAGTSPAMTGVVHRSKTGPLMSALGQKRTKRHLGALSALPLKADIRVRPPRVRFVPCVDGSELARLFFTFAGWSVQPCVRPVSAAHKAAGHNALRGSGPGQKPAFENALAHVGCPDRRIGRLCITCCSPSQPSHHAG